MASSHSSSPRAKRRRLESPSRGDDSRPPPAIAPSIIPSLPSIDALVDPKCCLRDLRSLKKALTNSETIASFASEGKSFATLLSLVFQLAEKDDKKCEWVSALRESLSIVANCCHFSLSACLQVKNSSKRIAELCNRILESRTDSDGFSSPDLCNCVLRLLGNLSAHKETALIVVQDHESLRRIVECCERPALQKTAVRVVRQLANLSPSFAMAALSANAALQIGRLLVASAKIASGGATFPIPQLSCLLPILQRLAKTGARDVGSQLAAGECSEVLLSAFFTSCGSRLHADLRSLIVDVAFVSVSFRQALASAHAVERALSHLATSDDAPLPPSDQVCRLLAVFAYDAWGRSKLRESEGLNSLIARFGSCSRLSEKTPLVHALKQFVHDEHGMALLSHSRVYVETLICHLREYCRRRHRECKTVLLGPSTEEDIENKTVYRSETPDFVHLRQKLQECESTDDREWNAGAHGRSSSEIPLHKDFYASPSSSGLHRAWSSASLAPWSPSMSPLASSLGSCCVSPTSAHGDHSIATAADSEDGLSRSLLDDLFVDVSATVSNTTTYDDCDPDDDDETERRLIASELFLISWHSHVDQTLPCLIRADLIQVLLLHLRTDDEINAKAVRILMRMARCRGEVENLFALQFHSRILQSLNRSPCRLNRLIERCSHCESLSRAGVQLLAEFQNHADSEFGVAILVKRIMRGSGEDDVLQAAIAATTLIRSRYRKIRLLKDCAAVSRLIDAFARLLQEVDGVETKSSISSEVSLCDQILGALSTLVPFHKFGEIVDSDNSAHSRIFSVDAADVRCKLIDAKRQTDANSDENADEEEFLIFSKKSREGDVIARVSKRSACANSDYFQGMFESSFAENCTPANASSSLQHQFVFDENAENCSESHFRRFLHYLAGCRHVECFSVTSAHCALAMLQLSDRYLCGSLRDFLLETNGPVRRFINGSNLYEFLIVALSMAPDNRLLDVCLAILLRYSNHEETRTALLEVSKRAALVGPFIRHLRRFIGDYLEYS